MFWWGVVIAFVLVAALTWIGAAIYGPRQGPRGRDGEYVLPGPGKDDDA